MLIRESARSADRQATGLSAAGQTIRDIPHDSGYDNGLPSALVVV